jgi:hypothetical protein
VCVQCVIHYGDKVTYNNTWVGAGDGGGGIQPVAIGFHTLVVQAGRLQGAGRPPGMNNECLGCELGRNPQVSYDSYFATTQ